MRKLAIFSIGFAVAAAVYIRLLSPLMGLIAAGVLSATVFVTMLFHGDPAKRVRIAALGAVIGVVWTWGYEQLKLLPMEQWIGEEQTIYVEVLRLPEETDYGCKVEAKLGTGKILLYLDDVTELSVGDQLTVTADVIDAGRGSGEEENLYYQARDISLLGFQNGDLYRTEAEKVPFRAYPALAAQKLREKILSIFPEDTSGFALALLTGEKSGLSFGEQNALSLSGIAHVVSVSGMHVSLLAGMVLLLCANRRRLASLVAIPVMFFFAAMLGFTPSVTRAVLMNSVLFLAPLLKRENDLPTALSFALLLILMTNPWAIANVSFQLSFASMLGILLITPYLYKLVVEFLQIDTLKERNSRLLKPVKSVSVILATTFGATVTTTPIMAYHFNTVSLVAPLTNLLTMPVISFVFTGAFVAVLLGFLWTPLGTAVAWLLSWLIRYVMWVAESLSRVPYAAVYSVIFYIVAWLVAAYLLLGCYFLYRKTCRPAALAVSVTITLVGAVLLSGLETANMTLTAVDVGQGQCIVARSGGQTAVIDCGGDSGEKNGEDVARKLLMSGETKVDALILTHFDADHMCGVTQLMARMDVARLYVADVDEDSSTRALVLHAAEQEGAEIFFVTLDTVFSFGTGSIALYPPTTPGEDNASLAALLSFQEYDILITGDMSSSQERKLLNNYSFPDIEVLFAGHHGSKYSTCSELLEATLPETVIICVGKNSYGHPTQEVLDRIAIIGSEVYRTDLCGDITITR